jgi:hypothetical protein
MFPSTRLAHVVLAFGTLILALTLALPPVTFSITDLGVRVNGTAVTLVGNGTRNRAVKGTDIHFTACKSVDSRGACVHKEVSWDRAHGLHLAVEMTSRPAREM